MGRTEAEDAATPVYLAIATEVVEFQWGALCEQRGCPSIGISVG